MKKKSIGISDDGMGDDKGALPCSKKRRIDVDSLGHAQSLRALVGFFW